MIALDFDHISDLKALAEDKVIRHHATALYTTHSHTSDQPRIRVVICLESPISDPDEVEKLQKALAIKMGADRAATDAARLMFGNTKLSKPLIRNAGLSDKDKKELLKQFAHAEPQDIYRDGSKATGRSIVKFEGDQNIKIASGDFALLSDVEAKTPIFCPFHNDRSPSAFIVQSLNGTKGVHCSSCGQTYWPKPEEYDFDSFEKALQLATTLPLYANRDHQLLFGKQPVPNELRSLYPNVVTLQTIQASTIRFFESQYLEQMPSIKGLTFIKSPKGTGKTEYLSKLLSKQSKSVLLVGHRRSLIRQTCDRLDIDCYLDGGNRRHRYGVCLDSLRKVRDESRYDYLVIDEAEQVLAHAFSDTMVDKFKSSLSRLGRLVRNAKQVIVLDADLDWASFTFFTRHRTKKGGLPLAEVFLNEYKNEDRETEIYDSKNHLVDELLSSLVHGERCFVSSNSKTMIDRLNALIGEKLPRLTTLKITSDNSLSESVQTILKDVSNEILRFQCVLSSPSISTGVDIAFPDRAQKIDRVFGFFERGTTSHLECDQQLSRVRSPKRLSAWISPRKNFFETHHQSVRQDLMTKRLADAFLIGYDPTTDTYSYSDDDPLLDLATDVTVVARSSQNNLKTNFIRHKKAQGFKVRQIENEPTAGRTGASALRRGKRLYQKEREDQILNAMPIERHEFEVLEGRVQDNEHLNENELNSYVRYKIEDFYGAPISADLIRLDDGGRYRSKVVNFHRLTCAESILPDRDFWNERDFEDKKHYLLPQRDSASVFLFQALMRSPLYERGRFLVNIKLSGDDLNSCIQFLLKRRTAYEAIFDQTLRQKIRTNQVKQLNDLLRNCGLKLTKNSTKSHNGKKNISLFCG